jgi:glycerophosphoryl diester phosphodiesterase
LPSPSQGSAFQKPKKPLLLGHRGASKYLPENTFEAFDLALQHGCDGFELDVRRTSDAAALICHDRDRKGHLLADCVAAKFPGLLIFDEVIQRYSSRCFINIELKVEGLHDDVMESFRKHQPRRGFLVSSFKPEALIPLYELKPEFPLGLICKTSQQLSVWGQVPIDAVFAHTSLITDELRLLTAKAGKQLFVWTVNRDYDMRRFADMGVDGIISDDTALLAKTLGRKESTPAAAPR